MPPVCVDPRDQLSITPSTPTTVLRPNGASGATVAATEAGAAATMAAMVSNEATRKPSGPRCRAVKVSPVCQAATGRPAAAPGPRVHTVRRTRMGFGRITAPTPDRTASAMADKVHMPRCAVMPRSGRVDTRAREDRNGSDEVLTSIGSHRHLHPE